MTDQPHDFSFFVKRNAQTRGDQLAYTFSDGDETVESISFAGLDAAARSVATALQAHGLSGQRVLLLLESGLDFVRAFNGCLYAGAVAVPVNLPTRSQRVEKIRGIAQDSQAKVAITSARLAQLLREHGIDFACLELETLLSDPVGTSGDFREVVLRPDAPAFLQYTSGSTGSPKGVLVSHQNLIANQKMIYQGFNHDEQTVVASWLPLYHDMGLVGMMLHPAFIGVTCHIMPPLAFVQQPLRWLKLISSSGATTSGGPNFAYELCVRRIDPADMEGVDLSRWRLAFNGAEPIQRDTLERFAEKFAAFGFSRKALYPCYGMAEATLFISGGLATEAPRVCSVSAQALERGEVRLGSQGEGDSERELVSCGRGHDTQRIVIVDAQTCSEVAPGNVGEIWISGLNVALGYWRNEAASELTFHAYTRAGEGPFLRTGDLGFVRDGELFVTGRIKDLIIIAGRNHYPQDIERTVGRAHPAFIGRPGAAFALADHGAEELCVVQEVDTRSAPSLREANLLRAVREAVAEEHGVALKRVLFIAPGKLPLTTSGKVQRSLCRSLLSSGKFASALATGASEAAGGAQ